MICHWEGMEEKEEEKGELTVEGRRKKRLGRVIRELLGSLRREEEETMIVNLGEGMVKQLSFTTLSK